ncbi:hypothetical protein SMICM304S_11151 [Streptomyces microflavus]
MIALEATDMAAPSPAPVMSSPVMPIVLRARPPR